MILYNDVITVFNRVVTDDDFIWYPTVINNVHLVVDKMAIIASYGESTTDNAMINIRYTQSDGNVYVADKQYLLPKEWTALDGDYSSYVTFAYGTDFDFIYCGSWDEQDSVVDSDYKDGFYNYMKMKYDNVFDVTGVSKYNVLPHLQVTAK